MYAPQFGKTRLGRGSNLSFSIDLPVEYGGHISSSHLQTPNALKKKKKQNKTLYSSLTDGTQGN